MFNKNCRSKFLKNYLWLRRANMQRGEMNRAWCRNSAEERLQDGLCSGVESQFLFF